MKESSISACVLQDVSILFSGQFNTTGFNGGWTTLICCCLEQPLLSTTVKV